LDPSTCMKCPTGTYANYAGTSPLLVSAAGSNAGMHG
jgi:hypothetical protein